MSFWLTVRMLQPIPAGSASRSGIKTAMSSSTPSQRLGPIELMPGVTRRHAYCYLWAAFVSIGIFTYITTLQPFVLEVYIEIGRAHV